jgi:hypothetical protein
MWINRFVDGWFPVDVFLFHSEHYNPKKNKLKENIDSSKQGGCPAFLS